MNWLAWAMVVGAFPFVWLTVVVAERLEAKIGSARASAVAAGMAAVYGLVLGLIA